MNGLTFQDILSFLLPTSTYLIFDIVLYVIFFLSLLTMTLLPDKNMVPTLLAAGVMLFAIIGKLSLAALQYGERPIMRKADFGMYVINVGMLVFPLIAVGLTRKTRSNQQVKSTPFAILAGLAGGVYFFMFWVVHQRAA